MNSARRIVFGSGQPGGHHLVPEILEAGWGDFAVADMGHLRSHAHPNAFEFCFIRSGEVEWNTADSSDILREGDVYITQPNELHWGRDAAMHPCTLHWLILGSLGCGAEWPGIDQTLAVHLDSQLRQIRTHRLRGTAKLSDAFEEIFDEHQRCARSRGEPILERGNVRAALHRLLIELVRTHDRQREQAGAGRPNRPAPEVIRRALEVLHSNTHDAGAVRRLGESTGLDYRMINRQFVAYFGTTISQYWLRERVRMARKLLIETDMTVTAVAAEFGFSSGQHFSTVFRTVTGLTPGEYRHRAQSIRRQN